MTGANGFLGSEVVRLAQAGGLRVRASAKSRESKSAGVEYMQADLLDPDGLTHSLDAGAVFVLRSFRNHERPCLYR